MNHSVPWLSALLIVATLLGSLATGGGRDSFSTTWHRPEVEYLKAVNHAALPRDPEVTIEILEEAKRFGQAGGVRPKGFVGYFCGIGSRPGIAVLYT
jgi:hypothetical protein